MNRKPAAICPHCRRPVKALPISWREMEVLQAIMGGKEIKEIAFDFEVCEQTVQGQRRRLMEVAGVDNNVKLVRWALEQGFEFP